MLSFFYLQDLGHGPFSHVFDEKMKTKLIEYHETKGTEEGSIEKLKRWKHEDASCDMFDHMLENTEGLKDAFEKKNLREKERQLIKDLIKGKKPGEGPVIVDGKEKWFLFEIVANKVNEIDCDKFDYFARDCHNLGMKSNFDHLRYINNIRIQNLSEAESIRILKVKSEGLHLCVRDKLAFDMYELFHTRWSLHHRAYKHKTTKAIEEMITEAFLLLEEKYKFSEAISDMEKYAKLTDSIFYEILRSSDPDEKMKKAQAILRRIQRREVYTLYGQFQPQLQPPRKLEIADVSEGAKEIASLSKGHVEPNGLFLDIVDIHFGMKENDPVQFVIFYEKENDDPFNISRNDVSKMLPQRFSEQFVRVYGNNPNPIDKEEKKFMKECVKEWSKKYISGPLPGGTDGLPGDTDGLPDDK